MNALGLVRRLGPVDVRNIGREPLLMWSLLLPLMVALMLREGVPGIAGWLQAHYAFELAPYYPLVVGGYLLVAPSFVGFVGGFLFLDERDDRVLDAIRVTPVSMNALLLYRLGVPLLAGLLVTLVGYGFMSVMRLPTGALLAAACLGALSGPVLTLVLVGFAENKVTGFAIVKLVAALSDFPIVAWFVPMPWQIAAGCLPSYWPMKIVWQAAAGGPWFAYWAAGVVVNGVALLVLLRRLRRAMEG